MSILYDMWLIFFYRGGAGHGSQDVIAPSSGNTWRNPHKAFIEPSLEGPVHRGINRTKCMQKMMCNRCININVTLL